VFWHLVNIFDFESRGRVRRVETANNRAGIRRNKKVTGGGFRKEHLLLVSPPPSPDYLMRSLSTGAKKVRILANKL